MLLSRDQIIAAARNYQAGGPAPESPFVPDDLSRVPVWPGGNSSMRPTDPFVIRDELIQSGFSVRLRRPILGAEIADEELPAYFTSTPGVFVTAQKMS